MPFVSITRLRVRSCRYVPGFLIQSLRAALQARGTAGSLAVSVLRDANRAFWTRTVWRDEAAMRVFMRSGVHRRVMARLPEWCEYSPNAKGNFCFDRVIALDRSRCVLDLRLKR